MRTGQCLRRFESAHGDGVTSVALSREGSHVLSGSYDGLARVHGIKSGKMLKEFRGHTSYVNDAVYSPDGSQARCLARLTAGSWLCHGPSPALARPQPGALLACLGAGLGTAMAGPRSLLDVCDFAGVSGPCCSGRNCASMLVMFCTFFTCVHQVHTSGLPARELWWSGRAYA